MIAPRFIEAVLVKKYGRVQLWSPAFFCFFGR